MEPRSATKGSVDALPGLPDHEVLQELGRGGMGVVYLATNKVMGRNEVLKVVNPQMLTEPGAMDRFLQEIRSAAQLSHPNIVTAHAVLRSGESLVLAMEHIVGDNLYKVVGERGPLPVANACYYVHQVAMGLQHAFEKGMVHRDIKPDNLMLARDGKKHAVKILDFGLAKATREKDQKQHNLTGDGKMMGTPDYIAPEQILDAAKADIRADIYSLGCTLYYLLTGSPPFKGGSLYEKLQAHMSKAPTSVHELRNEVPIELAKIVDKMMAKDVKDRYQKPQEVAQALLPFVKGVKPLAAPDGTAASPGKTTTVAGAGGKSKGDGNTVAPTKTPKTKTDAAPKKTMIETDALDFSKSKPAANKPAAKRKIILLLGGGLGVVGVVALLLCLAGLWAGGVFRWKTADGSVLVVEVNEPNADVYVDGEKMTVTWGNDGKEAEIRVKPGTRKVSVEVKKAGFKVDSNEIDFHDGDRKVFRASLMPVVAQGGSENKNASGGGNADVFFNGRDFAGWEGLIGQFWGVRDGAIVGSTQPAGIKFNTFLCSKRKYRDFELQFQVKLTGVGWPGNSGVQFRSSIHDFSKFAVTGPQGDMGAEYWGSLHGENLGGMMKTADPILVKAIVKPAGFNDYYIRCEGKHVTIKVNDVVTVDGDFPNMAADGIIAWQIHAGASMEVNFKNIRFKELASMPVQPSSPVQPSPPVQPPVEQPPTVASFVPLFNGKDLSGWKNGPGQQGYWRVENAVLVGSGNAENYLFTDKGDFKDFHLHVRARISHLGNSGVFFRAQYGRAFPKSKSMAPFGYEVQINSTHPDPRKTGSLYITGGGPGFQGSQTNVPPPPPGAWFDMDVIAEGPRFIIKVNGRTTTDFFDNSRRFASGHLALQVLPPQTKAEFAAIEIKELNTAPPPALKPADPPIAVKPPPDPMPKEEPFTALFNGKDTAGWKAPPGQTENWRVENGVLMGPAKKASYLYSERDNFKNFHLRAEARVTDGSNGGIYFRVPQIMEKRPQGYKVLLNFSDLDLNKAGSLFNGFSTDLKPVRESRVTPGEWFTLEIFALRNQTVVKINKKQVAEFLDEKQMFRSGHVVLEQADAQTAVDFRKIEFRELGPDAKLSVTGAGPAADPTPVATPNPVPVVRPKLDVGKKAIVLNVKGILKATDPPDVTDQGKIRGRSKAHAIQMNAGTTYVISLNSAAFDAYLRLQNPLGKTVAEDDDSGGGLNARISYRCAESGLYRIIASTFNGKLGLYQLTVQESP